MTIEWPASGVVVEDYFVSLACQLCCESVDVLPSKQYSLLVVDRRVIRKNVEFGGVYCYSPRTQGLKAVFDKLQPQFDRADVLKSARRIDKIEADQIRIYLVHICNAVTHLGCEAFGGADAARDR